MFVSERLNRFHAASHAAALDRHLFERGLRLAELFLDHFKLTREARKLRLHFSENAPDFAASLFHCKRHKAHKEAVEKRSNDRWSGGRNAQFALQPVGEPRDPERLGIKSFRRKNSEQLPI